MSKNDNYPLISIKSPKKKFESFLSDSTNRRIIFSGVFGSGKTYFLKNFFQAEEKYYCIRLSPVNYSVSKNEDVFELIKFDIIFQLLKDGIVPKELGFTDLELLKMLSLLDPEKGIRGLIAKMAQTDHDILQSPFEKIDLLLKPQDEAVEGQRLIKLRQFLTDHEKKTGSPKEQDAITKLICYLLSSKVQDTKESILIIDDLDRIDPEHIFRILNVFAAHFDLDENANKFGFDRIVIVCDIQNIRRMFRNRYGQDTDFSGYIDKFYSRQIFHFDNQNAVVEAVSGILCSLTINPPDNKFTIDNNQSIDHRFMVYVLNGLIKVGALNLRAIWRMRNSTIEYERKQLSPLSYTYRPLVGLFDVLTQILGDAESLREGLQRCVSAKIGKEMPDANDPFHKYKLGLVIPIVSHKNLKSELFQLIDSKEVVTYNIHDQMNDRIYAQVISITEDTHETTPDIFPYILKSVDVLILLGLIK